MRKAEGDRLLPLPDYSLLITTSRSTHLKRNRREFLKTATLAGLGVWVVPQALAQGERSPNDRIRFACIGVGGKGEGDTEDASHFGDVVAICDIDDNTLNKAAEKHPKAKKYNDYRKMFDEMAPGIDAVTVSTADHSHAPASAMALKLKKHCFTQKPLTHTIYEARRLGELARENKVATQMGNQGTADSGVRRSAALLRSGVLGPVREVHVWSDRPGHYWPQ